MRKREYILIFLFFPFFLYIDNQSPIDKGFPLSHCFFLAKCTPSMIIMIKNIIPITLASINLFLLILPIIILINFPLLPKSLLTPPNFLRLATNFAV